MYNKKQMVSCYEAYASVQSTKSEKDIKQLFILEFPDRGSSYFDSHEVCLYTCNINPHDNIDWGTDSTPEVLIEWQNKCDPSFWFHRYCAICLDHGLSIREC
jgi:hypothetical protein